MKKILALLSLTPYRLSLPDSAAVFAGNRCRRVFTVALVLVLVSAGMALGAVTGKIAGTVTDPSGGGIPMVSVKLTNTAQGLETKVTADEHGDFIFPSVPVGTSTSFSKRKDSARRNEPVWSWIRMPISSKT